MHGPERDHSAAATSGKEEEKCIESGRPDQDAGGDAFQDHCDGGADAETVHRVGTTSKTVFTARILCSLLFMAMSLMSSQRLPRTGVGQYCGMEICVYGRRSDFCRSVRRGRSCLVTCSWRPLSSTTFVQMPAILRLLYGGFFKDCVNLGRVKSSASYKTCIVCVQRLHAPLP